MTDCIPVILSSVPGDPQFPEKDRSVRAYVWMLTGCFWFSLMAVFTHALAGQCDWQVVALARSGLATIFALTVALVSRSKLVFLRPGILWVRSLSGSCSMLATFYALTHLPISDVLTLTNTFPIWVALLSWPLSGEKPTVGVGIAVISAVVGVAMTQEPTVSGLPLAAWSALAASVFTAIAMMGLNRLKGVSSLGVVVHFSAVSTLFCGAAFILFDREMGTGPGDDPAILAKLLAVGTTATVGQVFLTLAFRAGSATRVSVVGLSQVVMVMVFEAVGGRRFDTLALCGTVLVLGPTAWLMTRAHRPPADPSTPVEEVAIE